MASPVFVPTATSTVAVDDGDGANATRNLMQYLAMEQTPSASGIATGGATIYDAPGGRGLASVPVAGIVTITGKSADGKWYAVYNDAAVYGWTPVGQLRVFGGDDLIVVDKALDPAPVATMIAQAMEPVKVLDSLMPTLEAQVAAQKGVVAALESGKELSIVNSQLSIVNEEATPVSSAVEPISVVTGVTVTGTVVSEGRLNLRAQPSTTGEIVAKLASGSAVQIVGRSDDGEWLQVSAGDNTGWVSADFVRSN